MKFKCFTSNTLSLGDTFYVSTGTNGLPNGLPPASATPPAYVYIDNLCNRLGVIIGNHILDVINEG